jgi:branched-chain amino acid transport system permease protein
VSSSKRFRLSPKILRRGAGRPASISQARYSSRWAAPRALWVIYFIMVAVMGLSLYLSYAIKRSKFGLGLLAIGQNEDAAAILGVPTPLYKAIAYTASAFLPAIAGGTYFFKSAFIQPSDAFDLSLSTEALVVVMLGGQGTVTGVALGAYLYEELRGYLLTSETFSNFQLVISGVLLLLIVLFLPTGLMGFIYSRFPRAQKVLE